MAASEMSKTAKREAFIAQLAVHVETSRILRDVLERNERAIGDLAERVGRGDSVLDAFTAMPPFMQRHRELPETMEQYEAVRQQTRLSLFDLAIDEGASASELARRLGISRQLASRLAARARGEE